MCLRPPYERWVHELLQHRTVRRVKPFEVWDALLQVVLGPARLAVFPLFGKGERHLFGKAGLALPLAAHQLYDLRVRVQPREIREQMEQRRRLHAHEVLEAQKEELLALEDAQRAGDARQHNAVDVTVIPRAHLTEIRQLGSRHGEASVPRHRDIQWTARRAAPHQRAGHIGDPPGPLGHLTAGGGDIGHRRP